MNYHEMLKHYLSESGWSMREVSKRCEKRGVKVSQGYLSLLANAKVRPASDRINKELGDLLSIVTDIPKDALVIAAYKIKVPSEILEAINN